MKISLKWLNDFVEIQDMMAKPEALADLLTKAGLEVEEIQNRAKDLDHVVVGLILEKDKHPNADKLSLCKVTTGEGVVHQIVCGAQNHKQNDKVVVALPGAVLPGNFVIKNSVLRGVESGGMLCSLKEVGLAKESEGIMILPEDAPIGKAFAQYKGLDDITFELKVTPNRADCLSHYGLAREIACLLSRPLKKIAPEPQLSANSSKKEMALEVVASDLCPRYTGRYLKGLKVGASPEWLKLRLESVGLNSINNVVDVTNYVMMELGQPLHAFDANTITSKKVVVDKAKEKEKFITLDGTELVLTGEELMIKDSDRSLCIAGVIGGKNSGVTDATTEVFLESAYFAPASARKSSRTHGLNTDSGYRFSRGVDPEGARLALDRATEILLKVAGGEAYSEPHDFYPNPVKKSAVKISTQIISDRMGYPADEKKFVDFMQRLGCQVSGSNPYEVLPPTYRFDLEGEMDLVEEYARLHGYEHIPETVPALHQGPAAQDLKYTLAYKASKVMQSCGYQQAINYAFVGEKAEKEFLKTNETPIRLLNPLNEEMNVMRSSLSFGLFKNMNYNFHQQNEAGRLFEIGSTFSKNGEEYAEHKHLGLIAWGMMAGLWQQGSQHPLIFEVKAALEALLRQLNITAYRFETNSEPLAFLHRGQSANLIVEGKKVGFIGALHPVLLNENKIRVPVAMAELDLDLLFAGQPRARKFASLSRFPSVQRDLALVMAQKIKASEVEEVIKKEAGALLKEIEIFDVYAGDKLAAGQKSVAFRLTYQDKNATLQDQAVNDSIQKVLAQLAQKFNISVR